MGLRDSLLDHNDNGLAVVCAGVVSVIRAGVLRPYLRSGCGCAKA